MAHALDAHAHRPPDPPGAEADPDGDRCEDFAPDPDAPFFAENETYTDTAPLALATAEPAEVGLDDSRLRDAAENVALSPDVASLLVLRHGRLAFERYFNGRGPASADNVHSLSKSILSLITGIAIADGSLRMDTTIGDLLPEDLVGEHRDLTVRQLLTMAAGLESDEVAPYDWEPSSEPGRPSFLEAVASRPSVAPPDREFAYNTGLTQVLAAMLTEATGESLCAYAMARLFGPLGIDVEHWGMDLDGYFAGGHSLFLTPREVARIGGLVLDHGDWDGESLVPPAWVDESLTEVWDLGCMNVRPVREGYGYLWWLEDVAGHRVWRASGSHGQELLGVPDLDLLVVLTHDSSGSDAGGVVGPLALLEQYVLPAVDDTPPVTEGADCPSPALDGHTVAPDGSGRAAVAHWPSGALAGGWSPDGERLVGVLDTDLNREIYTFAPDGSSPERLTRDFAHDLMPAWSPDGTRIAFSRGEPADGDLYSVGSHGGGLRRLTPPRRLRAVPHVVPGQWTDRVRPRPRRCRRVGGRRRALGDGGRRVPSSAPRGSGRGVSGVVAERRPDRARAPGRGDPHRRPGARRPDRDRSRPRGGAQLVPRRPAAGVHRGTGWPLGHLRHGRRRHRPGGPHRRRRLRHLPPLVPRR